MLDKSIFALPRLIDAPIESRPGDKIGQFRGIFGESAVWSAAERGVWWVDMHGHSLVFSPQVGPARVWKTPGPALPWARAVLLREGGGLVVALSDTLAIFDPESGAFAPLSLDLKLPDGHLFNDAIVDPQGRIVIGTMLPGRGNDGRAGFFSIDPGGVVTVLVDALNTTNGLAFSPDCRTLYFSDSFAEVRKVWAADYNPDTGQIGMPRNHIDFAGLPGKPDGAAVDADGGYWIAAMGSRYVHRFQPDGRLDLSVELPVDTPTRPAFGGETLSTMFVTTGGLKAGEVDDGLKGGLLAFPTSFTGLSAGLARF